MYQQSNLTFLNTLQTTTMGVLEDITGEHVAAFADKSVTERNLEASGKLPPVFKQHIAP